MIEAAPIRMSEDTLAYLRRRLEHARWPDVETVDGWQQGVPTDVLRDLCGYWLNEYDWRRCETRLNGWSPSSTLIDGLEIHFLHIRSPEEDALPVVMTHGWPGSVAEFASVIAPLTDPRAYGGDPADAVHLVLPSLPGHGFSARPLSTGWTVQRTARAWGELMRRLGYGNRWVAQGGDWGAAVSEAIAAQSLPGCIGIHLNFLVHDPSEQEIAEADDEERRLIARGKRYRDDLSGYLMQQSQRPQTLGYALADSPVGQAAWILDRFHDWTDPASALGRDEILDIISIYWLTNTAASSARLYWETWNGSGHDFGPIRLPAAFSLFPEDIEGPSQRWAARRFHNIVHWGRPERGGHFAALEQPEIFVREVREGLRAIRAATA